MSADDRPLLERCRRAAREQAVFYRRLASEAELRDDGDLAQRLHDLHADEQHHLSRLTARLIELGQQPADLGAVRAPAPGLDEWEPIAREREEEEVRRYEALLQEEMDDRTRTVVEEILGVERNHARELGGKWTVA